METLICSKCGNPRRIKQFSLKHDRQRDKVCRLCKYDGIRIEDKPLVLGELYRHYLDFRDYVANTGEDVIEYAVPSSDPDSDDYHVISVSFIDLKEGVEDLPPRKKEAFFYRVILDKKQREVADIMQISMVSVGQYVKDSLIKLSKHYFGEDPVE